MQSDRDLLKQALEALVLAQKDAQIAEADYAITALRERLAQPEQEPRREWVGLTDEECIAAIDEYFNFALDHGNVSDRSVLRYARAIEAKIKDKNA